MVGWIFGQFCSLHPSSPLIIAWLLLKFPAMRVKIVLLPQVWRQDHRSAQGPGGAVHGAAAQRGAYDRVLGQNDQSVGPSHRHLLQSHGGALEPGDLLAAAA